MKSPTYRQYEDGHDCDYLDIHPDEPPCWGQVDIASSGDDEDGFPILNYLCQGHREVYDCVYESDCRHYIEEDVIICDVCKDVSVHADKSSFVISTATKAATIIEIDLCPKCLEAAKSYYKKPYIIKILRDAVGLPPYYVDSSEIDLDKIPPKC